VFHLAVDLTEATAHTNWLVNVNSFHLLNPYRLTATAFRIPIFYHIVYDLSIARPMIIKAADGNDAWRELLKEGWLTERKTFSRSFVREVKVTGNKVVLNYTKPIIPDSVTIEREVVLPTVHYSGPWGTVPELLFEKKGLIPAVQQLLTSK
jgi:hypothetical protein